MADTATGDQVGVRRFEVGDVTDVKRTAIEKGEEAALQSFEGKSTEEKEAIAKSAIESSKVEAEDMAEISKLLEGKRDALLIVDVATIKDESIPKEGLHLLIPKGELEKIKPRLQELGYSIEEIKQMGLKAEKGRSCFVFLYAKERGEKAPEKEKLPNLESVEKDLRKLEQKGKLPPEKVARYIELLSQLDDRALDKLALFYDEPKPSNPMAGHWLLGNIGVYPKQEDRTFMHEIGHHIFDGSKNMGRVNPDFKPSLQPETIAEIETLFQSLNDDEKAAVLAAKNQGWNRKPNEWFAQAFGTWINKQPGSENIDSPKYERLKKAFESVLAKKEKK